MDHELSGIKFDDLEALLSEILKYKRVMLYG